MTAEDVYAEIRRYFSNDPDVEVASGRGAQGIKYNKKMFIMFYKGDLLIKLSENRINEIISSGVGQPFDPGTGKIMKDRVLIPASHKEEWISLSEESKQFVMKS
ncbi:MAG: hypothetical protein ACXAD7_09675 [Candidatus Kariarchaeaceae archaeon]|jgi:hypothetical protein